MQNPIVKIGTELAVGKVVSIHKDGCRVEKDEAVTKYTLKHIEEISE